ncbi:hypothetical protein [Proteus cibi]|uniref:hypothetical protein n=1 Tax=Proteus cibi TaxID=2050966 RepID=UPI000D687F4D|nr:hypothetical protein [Proteus cibi]
MSKQIYKMTSISEAENKFGYLCTSSKSGTPKNILTPRGEQLAYLDEKKNIYVVVSVQIDLSIPPNTTRKDIFKLNDEQIFTILLLGSV